MRSLSIIPVPRKTQPSAESELEHNERSPSGCQPLAFPTPERRSGAIAWRPPAEPRPTPLTGGRKSSKPIKNCKGKVKGVLSYKVLLWSMKRLACETSLEEERTDARMSLYCSIFCLWSAMEAAVARALSIIAPFSSSSRST